MKRNAHLCETIAAFWLLFSWLAVLDWRDAHRHLGDPNALVNFGIWGLQILFIWCAFYFHRTETPREVLWLGSADDSVSAVIHTRDAASVFRQLSLHLPELTNIEIEKIVALTEKASEPGEAGTVIPVTFRGKRRELLISFEEIDNETLVLLVVTNIDLLAEVEKILASHEVETPTE